VDLVPLLGSHNLEHQLVAKALDWIQSTLGTQMIEERLKTQVALCGKTILEMFDTVSPGAKADIFGWHLYNCHAYFFDPPSYDPNAGCRIIPTFVSLGGRLDFLRQVAGAEHRLKAVASGEAEWEKTLFELLVAAGYAKAGWKPELLDPSPTSKKPDIHATVEGKDVYIECKRLSKSSGYAQAEREEWLAQMKPLADYMREHATRMLIDIVFHKELKTLPKTFLIDAIAPKLGLAVPGTIIDSDAVTVTIRDFDLSPLQEELKRFNLRTNGSRLIQLLFGAYEPGRRGYHYLFYGKLDKKRPLFISEVSYAAGLSWACDAARSFAAKARDVRDRLNDAIAQLPAADPGIVHVAVESYDGPVVERIRNERITKSLSGIRDRKELRVVHVHLVSFDSPPDEAWAVEETVFSTSFAPGRGLTGGQHAESPYRLKRPHVWSVEEARSDFTSFEGFGE
jgi:hypothetical protein